MPGIKYQTHQALGWIKHSALPWIASLDWRDIASSLIKRVGEAALLYVLFRSIP